MVERTKLDMHLICHLEGTNICFNSLTQNKYEINGLCYCRWWSSRNSCISFLPMYEGPLINLDEPIVFGGFPGSSVSKESACSSGDLGLIPVLGRSHGGRNGKPLQYPCLENPMDRGAWRATVHGVTRVGPDLVTSPPPPKRNHSTCGPDFAVSSYPGAGPVT